MSAHEPKAGVPTEDARELSTRLLEAERELAILRSVVDAAPVMLYQWTLSPTGEARFTFVSKGCEEIYGLTAERLLADIRYSMEVVHPDDMASFQEAVTSSARELWPFHWVGRVVLPEGVIRWLRAQSFPTRLPDGTTRWEGVILDITEQQQAALGRDTAERERSALIEKLREQNETLHRQAEAMRELATPIIPLASDVIALPLVGDIDPLRAQQILEALLGGASHHRARVAIIDITGVRTIDTYGAETLIRAAQGLRLLGTTAIVTGLRPAIAQTLVSLGVDFGSLLTRSTFQDGIVFALGLNPTRSRGRTSSK